ncbi:molybdate ABC transporter permease subunit [Alteromonas halophila]|uniref:Molybdenum transport system permease n=1 Tax=Alteromonas halophila TaxID=516698 RepID=A0A918JMH1_9ALTE|nr:molybdate ABC transporter permease subunit [Alteromonas halophila]GGW89649.1 molybdate ABC transporter permease [Alteromonas halophila]
MSGDWTAIWLTLKLAVISSLILMIIATPLAWWLAKWQHPAKPIVQAVIALPLVLPPTVLGFYLLLAFSPQSWLGSGWESLTGGQLAFSFAGLVIGSVIYSLPFAVQPLYAGFVQLDIKYLETAGMLGLSRTAQIRRVILPMVKPHIITALGLAFAHTLGEFGVVLMIGGNIPGETQVLSISLYDHVESLNYGQAHQLAIGLLIFSLILMSLLYRLNRKGRDAWNSRSG